VRVSRIQSTCEKPFSSVTLLRPGTARVPAALTGGGWREVPPASGAAVPACVAVARAAKLPSGATSCATGELRRRPAGAARAVAGRGRTCALSAIAASARSSPQHQEREGRQPLCRRPEAANTEPRGRRQQRSRHARAREGRAQLDNAVSVCGMHSAHASALASNRAARGRAPGAAARLPRGGRHERRRPAAGVHVPARGPQRRTCSGAATARRCGAGTARRAAARDGRPDAVRLRRGLAQARAARGCSTRARAATCAANCTPAPLSPAPPRHSAS
jgi:hypothetical protein